MPMPTLRIDVFGGFVLHGDDAPIDIAHATRLHALLTYLLLQRGPSVSRQQAASALWPDSSEAQARTNLRKQLLLLRQLVPGIDQSLRDDGRTLALHSDDIGSDLHEFLRAIAQRDYQHAVAVYKGELLPDCYDEWIAPERERLSALFVDALDACADELEERRAYSDALGHVARLARLDPLRESATRRLMRLHALNGDRNEALRAYHTFAVALKREIGAQPEEATRALFAQLSASEPPTQAAASAPAAPLVGRAVEWRRLRDAWAAAMAGRPQFVMITGEAGIGKTRLAEELLDWAGRQGVVTALARCYAAEGALAYAPIAAWLRAPAIAATLSQLGEPWLAEVARVLPEAAALRSALPPPKPLKEGWQRQRMFEALARAVVGRARTHEARLLIIDNAQWADRDSIEWLHYLLRHDPHARLLIVITARNDADPESSPLRGLQLSLARESQLVEIELAPLSSGETTQLAQHVAGHALAPGESATLYRETEGHPLFVVETMRMARADTGPATRPRGLPFTVQSVLTQRLEQLTPSARQLASQAACIGRAFSFEVLALVNEDGVDSTTRDLDELLRRRIVRENAHDGVAAGASYDFTHDKLREAAYARLSAPVRRLLHRRIATVLEQRCAGDGNAPWGQIAFHYDQASDALAAIPHYLHAAEAARTIYANADAIRDYRRAFTLLTDMTASTLSEEVARVGEALGDVLHHVGQDQESCAAYATALGATHSALTAAQLQLKTGNVLRDGRDYQAALRAYEAATQALGEPASRSPEAWRVWIQVQLETLLVHYWLGQLDQSDALIDALRTIINVHGSPRQNAAFFQTASRASLRRNRFIATAETVAYARAAVEALRAPAELAASPSTEFGLGFALLWHGQPGEAVPIFLAILNVAEQTGDISLATRCVAYLAVAYRLLDQITEAERYVSQCLATAETAHMPEYTALGRANAAWIAWRKDNVDDALRHAHAAVSIWREFPASHASTTTRWTAYFPLMAIAMRRQMLEQAANCARALLEPTQQQLPAAIASELGRALAACETGDAATATAAFQIALRLASDMHFV
jgi:DNA-binding SARP family transcriptional activator/tetratricopeptide (TPR) repeat protein